jgi:hypothetical protein
MFRFMATSAQRRMNRQQERDKQKVIAKLHKEFIERTKGKSDVEIMNILNQMGLKYGMKDPQSGSAELK